MNPFAVVILAALVLEYALGVAADLLNLRALRPDPPAELADVYDRDAYRRSQEYTRARTRFGLVPATFDLVALLLFWLLGGFAWLDESARALGHGPIVTGLLFVGALVLARSIAHLPFALYGTFVIEERFGFNRTTPGTFWADRAKALGLGALIGAPLLAAILWFFEAAGPLAWLWCWSATTVFSLALQFVAPTWLMPLFNRFTPLEDGELRDAILGYARKVDFPLSGIFVIDGSRRSTKANAFFTGFGRTKRIALFDTLVEKHTTDELVGVVAHEIGHYKRKHIVQSLALSIAHSGLLFWLLSVFLTEQRLFAAFGVDEPSTHAGLVFFTLLYTPVELVLGVLLQAFSRKNEYEADAYAAATTRAPDRLASALRKLARESLSNLTPHPFYVFLHYSHPPLLERVRALRRAPAG